MTGFLIKFYKYEQALRTGIEMAMQTASLRLGRSLIRFARNVRQPSELPMFEKLQAASETGMSAILEFPRKAKFQITTLTPGIGKHPKFH